MTDVRTFTFLDQAAVRVVEVDHQPWFVAADVCAALGITNSRQALSLVDDDEKGVTTSDTPGGTQHVSVINESGLYSIILRSRKPAAKPFKRWVTHEVLPTIRRAGAYVDPRRVDTTDPDAVAAAAQDAVRVVRELGPREQGPPTGCHR